MSTGDLPAELQVVCVVAFLRGKGGTTNMCSTTSAWVQPSSATPVTGLFVYRSRKHGSKQRGERTTTSALRRPGKGWELQYSSDHQRSEGNQ